MYSVELKPPLLRLNDGGTMFLQGKAVPVDYATAKRYENNPRFHVTGLNTRAAVDAAAFAGRPHGAALHAAIRDASAELEPDDDANFDRNGKFSHLALSNALGYAISPEERDAALHGGPTSRLEPAEVAPVKPITIKKNPAAQPKEPNPAQTGSPIDPTTKGAIE